MAIPDFQSLMLPLLKLAGDGQVHSQKETVEILASQFLLTDDERKELLPSGRQTTFSNRVAWAKAHLKMAGLVEAPKWGIYRVTHLG